MLDILFNANWLHAFTAVFSLDIYIASPGRFYDDDIIIIVIMACMGTCHIKIIVT